MNIEELRKAFPLIGELIKTFDSLETCPADLTPAEWKIVVQNRVTALDTKLRDLGIVAAVHVPNAFLRDVKHTPNPHGSLGFGYSAPAVTTKAPRTCDTDE